MAAAGDRARVAPPGRRARPPRAPDRPRRGCATSAPVISNETPPASTERNGAAGRSVWRPRVASISSRVSVRPGESGSGSGFDMGPPARVFGRPAISFRDRARHRCGLQSRRGILPRFLWPPSAAASTSLRHPLKRYLLVPIVLERRAGGRHHVSRPGATGARSWPSMVSSTPVLGSFFLGIMTVVGGVGAVPDRPAAAARGVLRPAVGAGRARRARQGARGRRSSRRRAARCCTACSSSCFTASRWWSGSALTAVTGGLGSLIGHRARRPVARLRRVRLSARPSGRELRREMGLPRPPSRPDAGLRARRHCSLSDSVGSLRRLAVRGGGCHAGVHRHRRKPRQAAAPTADPGKNGQT